MRREATLGVWIFSLLVAGAMGFLPVYAQDQARYEILAGDVLIISVWKEPDLQQEVLVRPDGGFSFPLVGEVFANGKSTGQLSSEITEKLKRYIPDPVLMVAVKEIKGNKIYVIGKVNRPGEFIVNPHVDVMQALSIAGGMTPYAALKDIKILRRGKQGQNAIPFNYVDIEKGTALEQNIILQSGDVVVVP